MNKFILSTIVILSLLTQTACATKDAIVQNNTEIASSDNNDPLEKLNRGVFKFNELLDGLIVKPMVHIYRGLVPEPAQHSVKNAINNLSAPVVFLNSVLQADVNNAGRTASRFAINSTLGIAGLFDVASEFGIKKERDKDFGQTLGVYGITAGPYLMLPIIGPSDFRDGIGLGVDTLSDPFTYIFTQGESVGRFSVTVLSLRNDRLGLTDNVYENSLDPYVTFRSIYLQHRAKSVNDYLGKDESSEKDAGK